MPYPFINLNAGGEIGRCGGVEPPTSYATFEKGDERRSVLFNNASPKSSLVYGTVKGNDEEFTVFFTIKRNHIDDQTQFVIGPQQDGSTTVKNGIYFAPESTYGRPNLMFQYRRQRDNHAWAWRSTRHFYDTAGWYSFVITVKPGGVITVKCNGEVVAGTTTNKGVQTGGTSYWFYPGGVISLGGKYNGGSGKEFGLRANMTMAGLHDGVAHDDVTDFGDFDPNTRQWVPKDPDISGWKNNSFYLSGKDRVVNDGVKSKLYSASTPALITAENAAPIGMVLKRKVSSGSTMGMFSPAIGNNHVMNLSGAMSRKTGDYWKFPKPNVMEVTEWYGTPSQTMTISNKPDQGIEFIQYTGTGNELRIPHKLGKKPVGAFLTYIPDSGANGSVHFLDGTDKTMRNIAMQPTNGVATMQRLPVVGFAGSTDKEVVIPGNNGYTGQRISGSRTYDAKTFVVGGVTYLILVNRERLVSSTYSKAVLYSYNTSNNTFVELQSFDAHGGSDASVFVANNKTYVFVSCYGDGTNVMQSTVYRFNTSTKKLDRIQDIDAIRSQGTDTFTSNGIVYLVTANGNSNSFMYAFSAQTEQFTKVQTLTGFSSARKAHAFTVGGTHYVCLAVYTGSSQVYKFNPTTRQLSLIQTLPIANAWGFDTFAVKGVTYGFASTIAVDGRYYNALSTLYRWDDVDERFYDIQSIPTRGASAFKTFVEDGVTYGLLAEQYDGAHFDIESRMFKFDEAKEGLVAVQSFKTNSAMTWATFMIGTQRYVLGVNGHGTGGTNICESQMYRWNAGCGAFEGNASVAQVPSNIAGHKYTLMLISDSENSQMYHACGSKIPMVYPAHIGPFTHKGRTYLAAFEGAASKKVKILRWDPILEQSVIVQELDSTGASGIGFLYFGGEVYMGAANYMTLFGSSHNQIWKWNGETETFSSVQTFTAKLNPSVSVFTAGGKGFLAFPQMMRDTHDERGTTKLYMYNQSTLKFDMVKSQGINGAYTVEHFHEGGKDYLMVACFVGSPSASHANAISRLFEFNPSNYELVEKQTFSRKASADVKMFVHDGKRYMVLSSQYDGTDGLQPSGVFRWNPVTRLFDLKSEFILNSARTMAPFKYNGTQYVVVHSSKDATDGINSSVYRFNPSSESLHRVQELDSKNTNRIDVFEAAGSVHLITTFSKGGNSRTMKWLPKSERFSSTADLDIRADVAFKRANWTVNTSQMYMEYDFETFLSKEMPMTTTGASSTKVFLTPGAHLRGRDGYTNVVGNHQQPWNDMAGAIPHKGQVFIPSNATANAWSGLVGMALGSQQYLAGMADDSVSTRNFSGTNMVPVLDNDVVSNESPFNLQGGFVETYNAGKTATLSRWNGGKTVNRTVSTYYSIGSRTADKMLPGSCKQFTMRGSVTAPFITYTVTPDRYTAGALLYLKNGKIEFTRGGSNDPFTQITTKTAYPNTDTVITFVYTTDHHLEIYYDAERIIRRSMPEWKAGVMVLVSANVSNVSVSVENDARRMIYPPAGITKGCTAADIVDSYRIIDPTKFFACGRAVGAATGNIANPSAATVTGLGFTPDFVMAKADVRGTPTLIGSKHQNISTQPTTMTAGSWPNPIGLGSCAYISRTTDGFVFNGGSILSNSIDLTGHDVNWMAFKESPCSGFQQIKYTGNAPNTQGTTRRVLPHNLEGKPDVVMVINLTATDVTTTTFKLLPIVWCSSFDDPSHHLVLGNDNAINKSGSQSFSCVMSANNIDIGGAWNQPGHDYLALVFKEVPGFSQFGVRSAGYTPATPSLHQTPFTPAAVITKRDRATSDWFTFGPAMNAPGHGGAVQTIWSFDNDYQLLRQTTPPGYVSSSGYVLRDHANAPSGVKYLEMAWAAAPYGLGTAV